MAQRMMKTIDWSLLPKDLLILIVLKLSSILDIVWFRSVSTHWRSSAPFPDHNNYPLLSLPLIHLNHLVVISVINNDGEEKIYDLDRTTVLSRASFFRLTPSSSSSQGWLIKYKPDQEYGTFRLLNPLSCNPLARFQFPYLGGSMNLLDSNVSEIETACTVPNDGLSPFGFKRVVLGGNHRILGVGCDGIIRYWSGETWTRIEDQVGQFCDIIVANGLTYAVDSIGIIWWISSSLEIFRYGPSLDDSINIRCWKERSLVECCGEFYIVDRLLEKNLRRGYSYSGRRRTSQVIHDDFGNSLWVPPLEDRLYSVAVGFKVYKMDEELAKWVEVKSLGCNAFVMATDGCFSVFAREFYGCVQSAIYFSDKDDEEIKMFMLDDESITTMSGLSQTCFRMFVLFFDLPSTSNS